MGFGGFPLLQWVVISTNGLPPISHFWDAPFNLLPYRQDLNELIREDIYNNYFQVTWISPLEGLSSKMSFYLNNFMQLGANVIVKPEYTSRLWMYSLRIPLSQFKVGSHRVDIDHHILRAEKTCWLCYLQETQLEEHLIFRCPIYYEIKWWFHCLYRDQGNSLSIFFYYPC